MIASLKRRRTPVGAAVLAGALALAGCGASEPERDAQGREQLTLTLVSADSSDVLNMQPFFQDFIPLFEQNVPWVTLDYRGGPEVMEAGQIAEAVGNGTIDMGLVQVSAYTDLVPIAHSMKMTSQTPSEERESGAYEIVRQQHAEDGNVHYLGKGMSQNEYRFYFTQAPTQVDPEIRFDGMQLRVSPVYVPIVEALGGGAVQTPPAEAYTALERGVVQGLGYPSTGFFDRGFDEIITHELDAGFFDASYGILINLDTWEDMDEETRQAITDVTVEAEPLMVERTVGFADDEFQRRRDAGIELVQPSEQATDQFLETAYNQAWEDAIDVEPEAEQLREIYGN